MKPSYLTPSSIAPPPPPCPRCEGCGRIANDAEGTPWSYWESLPPGANLAVLSGLVAPIMCPICWGSGKVRPDRPLAEQYLEAIAKPEPQTPEDAE